MKLKTPEEKLRNLEADHGQSEVDKYLQIAASLFRTDLPTDRRLRKQVEQERKRLRKIPGFMDKLREKGLWSDG